MAERDLARYRDEAQLRPAPGLLRSAMPRTLMRVLIPNQLAVRA
jgi:hypothetical protein